MKKFDLTIHRKADPNLGFFFEIWMYFVLK